MHQGSGRPVTGSSRRRQARNPGTTGVQRNYASENDMPARSNTGDEQHRFSPQTPQKSASGSPAPFMSAAPTNSKSRSRNKFRPDNISLSPESSRTERPTPLQTSAPKSSTATAFAGATFHASPAPSALPLPKFSLKANESPNTQDKIRTSQDQAHAANGDPPTPQRVVSNPQVQESPLEFMFKADREEKEKARRASMAHPQHSGLHNPVSPPAASPPARPYIAASSLPTQAHRSFQNLESRSSAQSASTADGYMGHIGQPIGPSFSTPYHERIRAARTTSQHSPQKPENDGSSHRTSSDRTAALKQFIFASPKPNLTHEQTSRPGPHACAATESVTESGPVPITSSDSEPKQERDARVVAMEEGLRRILKLGSS